MLRNLKKALYRAIKKDLPIIFSCKASSEYNIRSSYSLLGFMEFLDVPNGYYENNSQNWLKNRLKRNKERKNDKFIVPGVWMKRNEEVDSNS